MKIVQGKLKLHAGEILTLYDGWAMDLVYFREKFDGQRKACRSRRRTAKASVEAGAHGDKRGRWRGRSAGAEVAWPGACQGRGRTARATVKTGA